MRIPETSDSRCVLSKTGLEKLNNALKKIFNCEPKNFTDSKIGDKTRVDRELVGKIRTLNIESLKQDPNKEALKRASIEKLFDSIDKILVEEHGTDYPAKLNIEKIVLNDKDYQRVATRKPASKPSTLDKTKNISQLEELRNILFGLDYKKQCQVLEDFREINSSIGAFLIQGERNRGQRWLVNRLVQQNFPYAYETDKLIPIIPPTTKDEKDFHIGELWEKLGEKLELRGEKTAKRCVEKALKRWQSGSLIMAFYTDNIYQDIPKIIDDFWKPLAERASYLIEEEEIEFSLVMFLIDSSNRISQSGIEMVESVNQANWHPQKLIALPTIENFGTNPNEVLLPWCLTHRNPLKCCEESSHPVKPVAKKIWDNSQGVPEKTFAEIGKIVFDSDDFSWSKFEQQLQYKL